MRLKDGAACSTALWRCCCLWLMASGYVLVEVKAVRQSPPHIIKQPPTDEVLFQVATQQNENDKPFIIECEAEGEPAPKYRWIKNGKNFNWQAYDDRITQQPGRGTLVITKPRNEDLGQYQCFAENEWGIATSNSVFVRKAELNSFKDDPTVTLVAKEGEPYNLTCNPPDGWPKPNVYWLIQTSDGGIKSINSSRMTLDPEGNLWFSNVTRQDASGGDFTYACTAMSVFRNEYKLGNKVVLKVIPTGSSPGQNRVAPTQQYVTRKQEVALRDKKVQLFCIYGGTPLPQTVWFKDSRPLHTSDRISQGNYGKSLVIKHVTNEDEGDYTCEASNGVGDAKSYSINLKVLAAPFFTEEPELVNAAEGESAVFHCKAQGNPEPQIQWIYNGKPIAEAAQNVRRKVTTNTVTIERLEKTDTGNYGCNATNSLGYVYKDVYVNVLSVIPEISELPRDEETVSGRNITLLCRVIGVPKPEIKWIRNGVELTGGRYTILESGDLNVVNVGFSDMGQYTCHARNKLGEASASGNLTVKLPTVIKDGSGPVDYEVKAGSPATFHCLPEKDASLDLSIDWQRNGEIIDFESEPRFVQAADYLTITKTTELDSGIYTCVASTRLDEATAQATLIVQDVPNSPKLKSITCNQKDASVMWQPMGDNRAPILSYIIQYNTSFTPDIWDVAFENVPAAESSYTVPVTPWANYTFRVIARNKIGLSLPSTHSSICRTDPDVPYKNPDNVQVQGTKPDNVVITWTAMPEIEHNAPRFHYQVFWKRDIPGSTWTVNEVIDWREKRLEIPNQPTFQPYIVKVIAVNERGQANVSPLEVAGYSGENVPTESVSNLTLVKIVSATTAEISWSPVRPESLRGHFKGYKIQTWTEGDTEKEVKSINVDNNVLQATVTILTPNSRNYIRVLPFNGGYNGPPSEPLQVDTPEGVPGAVQWFEAIPLGQSGFYLTWKPPLQPNGKLTGYRIYYQAVSNTELKDLIERKVVDANHTSAKLSGLEGGVKYRICINATTNAGIGAGFWIERDTRTSNALPGMPTFYWSLVDSSDIFGAVKVTWIPNERDSGTHFYVKYRIKGETISQRSKDEFNDNFVVIRGLKPAAVYEFSVVSVDGDYNRESDVQEIEIYSPDNTILLVNDNVVDAGWFVGMMLAIAILILILILVCIVKRNRGGKYIVHEQEAANRRQDYPDEPGFREYSQPLGATPWSREPAAGAKKPAAGESDTDSMAEYAEGDTEGMNEDGSFIGLYGKQKKQGETSSAGFATLV